MEIAEHIKALEQEARLFAAAAERGGLDVEIPTCPGWNMRDLVRHLSEIHLWAAAHVDQRATKMWVDDLSELSEYWPDLAVFWPDDEELVSWYSATNANLVNALKSAPLDLDCRTFLPAPSPLAMWARRQAHETAVHRFDAENGSGAASGFDPSFASDGIDELLAGFSPRRKEFPVDRARTMVVHAIDTDDRWHVTLSPEGITTRHGDGPADLALSGDASDLYLVLWNRLEDARVTVAGDDELLAKWHGNSRIRWS